MATSRLVCEGIDALSQPMHFSTKLSYPAAKKKYPLGEGHRFAAMTSDIQKRSGYSKERAAAIAASIGRKKYGKAKFQKMAAAGRKK